MRVYNVPQLLNEEKGIERVQLYLQCKKKQVCAIDLRQNQMEYYSYIKIVKIESNVL